MKNPAFAFAKKSPVPVASPRRPRLTREQTIATLRRVIRTLRGKNTQLAERLLIDLGQGLAA